MKKASSMSKDSSNFSNHVLVVIFVVAQLTRS